MINDRPLDHQDDQGLYAKMIMYDNQVQEALMIKMIKDRSLDHQDEKEKYAKMITEEMSRQSTPRRQGRASSMSSEQE